jgi:cytochrome oxidase Cu insertion factor (SCO1/SenC/PrrC family)
MAIRRRVLPISALLAGIALASVTANAQLQPRPKIDVSKLGPQVGESVPDFSLKDQNGKVWTLKSIMDRKGAMLVFLRSADW